MTNQEIFDLISRFEDSSLHTLKLSTQDFSIELSRGGVPVSTASAPAPRPTGGESRPDRNSGPTVNAPLVGTYYAAPAPGQPPFVSVGDRVKKGQPLCLIEAMKMMSEIPAPCDCVIEEVLKADGQLAAFDEPLFRYQPC
ncbi:Biotin carboxyl carrier protein of acetyl-CoA carboxylase [uncultured Clostridium sp.]|nr:Biotin carboxyl carrier protein of acetyl-CoA carboxylase [uncultured Clostridium sp.]